MDKFEIMDHLVSVRGIEKHFGDRTVFRNLSVTIEKGQHALITGVSGCGKTTFLRTLALLERVDEGSVWYGSMDVTSFASRPVMAQAISNVRVGYVSQERDLWPHLTVKENITLALRLKKGITNSVIAEKMINIASALDLTEEIEKFPAELSGGQRQRCAIARCLVHEPDLLLLDEVTANLDFQNIQRVMWATEKAASQGATIVMVSHRTDLPTDMFDLHIDMSLGKSFARRNDVGRQGK